MRGENGDIADGLEVSFGTPPHAWGKPYFVSRVVNCYAIYFTIFLLQAQSLWLLETEQCGRIR